MSITIAKSEVEGRWIHLRSRCLFRVSGPDRVRYLNGQVSNSVSGPLHEQAVQACLCSLKGRVEALVSICAVGEEIFIDGEISQREFLLQRLDRYLIADDCEIEDVTDEFDLYHHFREDEPGIRSSRLAIEGKDRIIRIDGTEGFPDEVSIGDDDFSLLLLRSAVPLAGLEITGNEFPSELGIEDIAVDYAKGCYLGQEVISRLKSVGRTKRALRLITAEESMEREAKVRNELDEEGILTRTLQSGYEKKLLGMALFKKNSNSTQSVEVEAVAVNLRD